MRPPGIPSFRTLEHLRVLKQSDRQVVLASERVRVELSVPAAGLFRFRATRRRSFSATPSWAVVQQEGPQVPSQVEQTGRRVRLGNHSGSLEIDLSSGRLTLREPDGNVQLQTDPRGSGFRSRLAQLAVRLSGGESFLGMGESSGAFDRAGLIQKFWNTDALGHGGINPGLRNLYTSIPFTLLLRKGRALGLFWDNPARQEWDLGQADRRLWQLRAASGDIDVYLFTGPAVTEVMERYSALTGRMPLPPRWALGYHQCRYSYESRAELEAVARQLRRRRIPCDALYLDIHHMDGFRVFTFGSTFPKPADMLAALRRRGFHAVAIVDPGVKLDRRFGVYRRGKRIRAYIRTPDGRRDYVGRVWPGRTVFPDFLNERVRRWWGREQSKLQGLGVGGFWNDMNEPANFVPPTKTLPEACRHDSDSGPLRHAEAHNLYGMQMARASHEGALRHRPRERPFIITRAAYAGTQRHATLWTGDNASSWEQLADSVQLLLNLGLSGFPFCGSDAGGFLDNCTPELYARWMQMAAFTPFFRNHTMVGTLAHEPWSFGPEIEAIVRSAIGLRYQLLPYWYCLLAEAHRTGAPVMRPLLWHFQDDPIAAACGDQFLLGGSMLVAPVLRQGAGARSVYLPAGVWFDFWSGQRHRGRRHIVAAAPLDRLPLYVRGGSIIPMTALRQHTGGPPEDRINLRLWPEGTGHLNWYEDDGISTDHQAGRLHRRDIRLTADRRGLDLVFGAADGTFPSAVRTWRVILRNAPRAMRPAGAIERLCRHRRTSEISFNIRNRLGPFTAGLR